MRASGGRLDGAGGLSASTVHHHHRVLRCALQRAVRWGLIASNPALLADPPRPRRPEIRILDEEDTKQLLMGLRGRPVYLATVIAVGTGMRRGEILGLQWQDIDLAKGVLRVTRTLGQTREGLRFGTPKTQRGRRQIHLPGFVVAALRDHWEARRATARPRKDDLVVTLKCGRPWPPDSFSAEFVRQLEKAGLPRIRFHDLRHSHASLLLRLGVHPKVVSERLGHATVSFTLDTYSHLLPSMQAEAAAKVEGALLLGGD